jgi:hypothetical protein
MRARRVRRTAVMSGEAPGRGRLAGGMLADATLADATLGGVVLTVLVVGLLGLALVVFTLWVSVLMLGCVLRIVLDTLRRRGAAGMRLVLPGGRA